MKRSFAPILVSIPFIFVLLINPVLSQKFDWAFTSPGIDAANNISQVNDLEVDGDGNIHMAGILNGQSIWGSDTLSSFEPFPGVHIFSSFLAQFDKDGNLLGVESFDSDGFINLLHLEVDAQGNVYAYIEFIDKMTISGTTFTAPRGGNDGTAIIKWDSDLNIIWSLVNSNDHLPFGLDVATDLLITDDSGLYLTGKFGGETNFWGVTLDANTDGSLFLLRINSDDGQVEWGQAFGDNIGFNSGGRIGADKDNNIYYSAGHIGEIEYRGTTYGDENITTIITSKWDKDGNYQWARASSTNATFDIGTTLRDIAVTEDALYITGGFAPTSIDFGNGVMLERQFENSSDQFLVKYDLDGNAIWGRQSVSFNEAVVGRRIGSNEDGDIILAGKFVGNTNAIEFQGGNSNNVSTSSNSIQLYMLQYSSAGDLQWYKETAGIGQFEMRDMAVTGDQSGAIAGYYTTELILDNATYVPTPSTGSRNLFLTHVSSGTSSIHDPKEFVSWSLSPNPADDFVLLEINGERDTELMIRISDVSGKKIHTQRIKSTATRMELDQLLSGHYTVTLSNESGQKSTKSLILK